MNTRFLTRNVCLWTRKLGREEFGLYLEPKLMFGIDFFRAPDHMTVWFTIWCITFEWIQWEADILDDGVYAHLNDEDNES